MVSRLQKIQFGPEGNMKYLNSKLVSAILLTAILLAAFPITAFAASSSAAVIGSSYTLESGQTLNEDLFVLGGNVNLKDGSTVTGNVILIGCTAQAAGTINGDLVVLGGTVTLADTFKLNGNLTYAGTVLNRAPGAQITGQINSNTTTPYFVFPSGTRIPMFNTSFNPFRDIVTRSVGYVLGLILWTLVAMLVAMFLPAHLTRTSETALTQPLLSGGLGILTVIIVPIILVLLAITICLSPVAFLGAVALIVAWVFGLISLGLEVGKRIMTAFRREWHPAITAGLGTLVLMAVLNGIGFIPCVGWIPKVLVGVVGLGAVLLTQFGRKPYIRSLTVPPASSGDVLPPPA
jgi:hypothetical protein